MKILIQYGVGLTNGKCNLILVGRTQEVVVNGVKSKAAPVVSGIPQGSVIGPLLFVIYINDLLDNIECSGYMFADDTKIFRKITSKGDAETLQSDFKVTGGLVNNLETPVQCREMPCVKYW